MDDENLILCMHVDPRVEFLRKCTRPIGHPGSHMVTVGGEAWVWLTPGDSTSVHVAGKDEDEALRRHEAVSQQVGGGVKWNPREPYVDQHARLVIDSLLHRVAALESTVHRLLGGKS